MATKYSKIGICIYCGKTESEVVLKDEHIVPFSLNGESILPKASCGECEKITSAFEGKVVNTLFKSFRLIENVKTRRPNKRPKGLDVETDNGEILNLETSNLFGIYPYIHFKPPGFLLELSERVNSWEGTKIEIISNQPKETNQWANSKSKTFGLTHSFDLNSYSLLIAKIAHCIAIGALGAENFTQWLPDYILGKRKSGIQLLVGGVKEIQKPIEIQHETKYEIYPFNLEESNDYYISVKIRLFSYLGGPHCQVIVGVTDNNRMEKIKEHIKRQAQINNAL